MKSREKIISLLLAHPEYSAKKLSEEIGITQKAIEKQLAKLKAEGRIKRNGPDKGGRNTAAIPSQSDAKRNDPFASLQNYLLTYLLRYVSNSCIAILRSRDLPILNASVITRSLYSSLSLSTASGTVAYKGVTDVPRADPLL